MYISFKIYSDRFVILAKWENLVRHFQLSTQQLEILEYLYMQKTLTSRRNIQKLVFNRPQKYTQYGYQNVEWRVLTDAQRASYSRSIRRLVISGFITTEKDSVLGLCDKLTEFGEGVIAGIRGVMLVGEGKTGQLSLKQAIKTTKRAKIINSATKRSDI